LAARLQDKVPLGKLISHRFSIKDASKALEAVKSGKAIKAVIDPSIR
jgi:Zn-dependent alcohol dehydrogenase